MAGIQISAVPAVLQVSVSRHVQIIYRQSGRAKKGCSQDSW